MNSRRLAALTILPLTAVALTVPLTHAAVSTCRGVDATIVGTDGPEKLSGTSGNDVVVLGGGDDVFTGKEGNDLICGGDGDDIIYPGTGNDTVAAGDGDDKIYEGPGDDDLNGGGGADRLLYSNAPNSTGLRIDARTGKATSAQGTDTFISFVEFVGTIEKDVLIGTTADEYFVGGESEDVVYGFGGRDRVISSCDEHIDTGIGNDEVIVVQCHGNEARVILGYGSDRITFQGGTTGGRWSGGPGADFLRLQPSFEVTSGFTVRLDLQVAARKQHADERWAVDGFENVSGSAGPDDITGNGKYNSLLGNAGNDVLRGLAGDDTLLGGSGTDVAVGGTGNDFCIANAIYYCERP